MSNYSSMDGILYCKTHFEQLFKESGNFSKNFQTGKLFLASSSASLKAPLNFQVIFSANIISLPWQPSLPRGNMTWYVNYNG